MTVSRDPFFDCARLPFEWWRVAIPAVLLAMTGINSPAATPAYLHQALVGFNPVNPPGWAYTLTTRREDRTISERHDPSKPPGGQWALLTMDGRPPTAEETEKYGRARSAGPGGSQSNFTKADIEPGSLQLIRETQDHAEFSAEFREAATGADKMLGHLLLRLKVDKRVPYVSAYILELKEPYSPILGVKMQELRVEALFRPPNGDQPSLLSQMTSHFAGRIFFFSTGEDLRLTYQDYTPPPNELSR
jgi:hypothetical protein